MAKQTIKTGTRIMTLGPYAESGKIGRWTKVNGPIKNHVGHKHGGWHLVKFDAGGALIIHETGFCITDNRA